MLTDAAFMLAVLSETPGEWVAQNEILQRSLAERGCGLTVHSRASTLRDEGHRIENRVEKRDGRAVSFYRLVSLDAAAAKSIEPSFGELAAASSEADRGVTGSLFELDTPAKREVPAWA